MNGGYILNTFEGMEEKEIQEEHISGLANFINGIFSEKWSKRIHAGLRAVE